VPVSLRTGVVVAGAVLWGRYVPAQLDHLFGYVGFTSEGVALLVLVLAIGGVAHLRNWEPWASARTVGIAAVTFVVAHLGYVVWACSRGCAV
jgi:hypothetical protein